MGEHRGGEASSHLARRNFAPGGAAASGAGGGATSPRRWADAAPGLGPAWQSGSLASHPGLGACELIAGHPLSLPPSSFPLFFICPAQTCKLLPCTTVSDFRACLFILQIFFFSFFVARCGLSDRWQNECSGAGAWCGGAGHGACQPWGGAGKGSVSISVPRLMGAMKKNLCLEMLKS